MELPRTAAEWAELFTKPPRERAVFSDAEAVSLSGVTVGGLRRLQAVGAITAIKAPKVGGGSFRVWGGDAVYIARIAGDIQRAMKMEISKAGSILRFISREMIVRIITKYDGVPIPDPEDENSGDFYDKVNNDDWVLNTYDNDFVCIEKIDGSEVNLLGWVSGWQGNVYGVSEIDEKAVEGTLKQIPYCRYKTSLNISMSLRDVYFYRWSDSKTLEAGAESFPDEE